VEFSSSLHARSDKDLFSSRLLTESTSI
jgi:hypothetical protein